MPRLSRTVMAGAAVTLVGLSLAGCAVGPTGLPPGGTAETKPAETPLPDGVTVEFMQLRSDVAKRAAQVRVVNGSGETLEITRLAFEDDWFDGAAVRDKPVEIAAGRTLDLTIQLPPSACDEEPQAADRTSRVVLDYSQGDEAMTSTADLPDPLEVIPALHARECLLSDLERSAALAFTAFQPSEAGQAATLTLTLTPTGEAASEVLGIQSTNLLALGQPGATADLYPLGAVVTEGMTAPIVLEIPLIPFRCDPHAVQEDKRGTIFTLDVTTGGQTGVVNVAAPDAMKGELLAWVADWCGFGS